jgi:4-hydroxybenzoate polyprenyltransferase
MVERYSIGAMSETPTLPSPFQGEGNLSDIPRGGWLDRRVPPGLRPYARLMRLDRPIGTWLLLFPCWWSLALAWRGLGDLWLFALFGIGAVVMRGAGCTYNDICDKDFDAQVARTRDRPLPSGEVSVLRAWLFFFAQLVVGLAILLALPPFAVAVGAASLLLVFSYPLMKRITFWPQLFLGFAFNWGALLGWAAIQGPLTDAPILLYVGGVFWTLGYDTIYAHQDKRDDPAAGVKSTALRLMFTSRKWIAAFYAMTVALFALSGLADGLGSLFLVGLAAGAAQLAWQVWDVDLDEPSDCLAKFRSNRLFGWLVLAAIFAGHL